jgi:predicted NBD/HSP70 family sugar kinase
MGEKVLAVDLGGTNLRMAVVAEDGHIQHRERC